MMPTVDRFSRHVSQQAGSHRERGTPRCVVSPVNQHSLWRTGTVRQHHHFASTIVQQPFDLRGRIGARCKHRNPRDRRLGRTALHACQPGLGPRHDARLHACRQLAEERVLGEAQRRTALRGTGCVAGKRRGQHVDAPHPDRHRLTVRHGEPALFVLGARHFEQRSTARIGIGWQLRIGNRIGEPDSHTLHGTGEHQLFDHAVRNVVGA
ncbi:MAG: hypothetical protein HC872_07580 [Gammaproteobacteria bacterium]|nr:hypothetical protein [Gammaproteobacteria bacterium]